MNFLKHQALIVILSILPAMQVQSAVIEFSADSATLAVGETLEISILAKGFDELAGGIIDFSISSFSSISVDDVVIDSLWDFIPEKGVLEGNVWKDIGFDVFANESLNGDGLIATVSLSGLSAGVTTLTLLDSSMVFNVSGAEIISDSGIFNSVGFEITVVQTVPMPAAVWFMGSALIGLAGAKRKVLGVDRDI
jgi:hypothetical protein